MGKLGEIGNVGKIRELGGNWARVGDVSRVLGSADCVVRFDAGVSAPRIGSKSARAELSLFLNIWGASAVFGWP